MFVDDGTRRCSITGTLPRGLCSFEVLSSCSFEVLHPYTGSCLEGNKADELTSCTRPAVDLFIDISFVASQHLCRQDSKARTMSMQHHPQRSERSSALQSVPDPNNIRAHIVLAHVEELRLREHLPLLHAARADRRYICVLDTRKRSFAAWCLDQ